MTILKNIDKSSPQFIRNVTLGKHIPNGVITFRTEGGEAPVDYYKVTMTEVFVTAVNQTDAPDGARILERVSLLAKKFEFAYTPVDAKGVKLQEVKFSFDCVTNQGL